MGVWGCPSSSDFQSPDVPLVEVNAFRASYTGTVTQPPGAVRIIVGATSLTIRANDGDLNETLLSEETIALPGKTIAQVRNELHAFDFWTMGSVLNDVGSQSESTLVRGEFISATGAGAGPFARALTPA